MGRDQHLLTITAKATGAPDVQAGDVGGRRHPRQRDQRRHLRALPGLVPAHAVRLRSLRAPDCSTRTTFYILPGLNVDANDSYASYPNTENNPREPYRPADDDGDGLYDEDQTEDVDGDGEISNMFVEDPQGDLKLTPDGRRFVRDRRRAGAGAALPPHRDGGVRQRRRRPHQRGRPRRARPEPQLRLRLEPRRRVAVPDVRGRNAQRVRVPAGAPEHLRVVPLPQHRAPHHVLGAATTRGRPR